MTLPSTVVSAERDRLVNHVTSDKVKVGDLLTHNSIEELTGIPYRTSQYKSLIGGAIKTLRNKHSVHLASVPGQGYRIGTNDDCADYAGAGVKKIRRRARKNIAVGNLVERERLSAQKKASHDAYMSISGITLLFTSVSGVNKVKQIAVDTKGKIDAGDLIRLFSKDR